MRSRPVLTPLTPCIVKKMKWIITALALLTVALGLWAAWCWRRASLVQINPGGGVNSGEPEIVHEAWTFGIIEAATKSAQLNAIAASWTAAAALAGRLTTLVPLRPLWRG